MATLSVEMKTGTAGVFSRVRIELDGDSVARLKQGESRDVEVAKGHHVLQAHHYWIISRPFMFEVRNDNAVKVRVEGVGLGFAWGLTRDFTGFFGSCF